MMRPISVVDRRHSGRRGIPDPGSGEQRRSLALLSQRRPHLIILDIWLQNSTLDGMALLDVIKVEYPELPVIMISGHGNIETAVNAIKNGRLRTSSRSRSRPTACC